MAFALESFRAAAILRPLFSTVEGMYSLPPEGRRMRWHDWLGCGLVACSVAVGGCVTTEQTTAANLDLTRYNQDTECYGVNVARAQQPEEPSLGPKTATSLKEAPPQDVGDLSINGIPAARIRATVNTEAITDEEVKAACYPQLRKLEQLAEPERSQKQLEVFKETLEQIVEREVVLQVAFARLRKNAGEASVKKLTEMADTEFDKQWVKPIMEGNGIKTDADFRAALKSMNVSLPMMKRQWTRNWMAMQFMRQTVFTKITHLGHPQIEDYYNKHPEEFQIAESVDWEDVFVSEAVHPPRAVARQRAEAVLGRMRQGVSIDQLLKDKMDDGDSSYRDGHGFGHKRGEIKPAEAETALLQLKDGESALVEMPTGFHVLRMVKHVPAGMMPFDDPKTQKTIKEKLQNEMGTREMKKLSSDLRKQAVVEYFTR
jgi:peptidyl-prolyl cis-trans isomerase SurA